MSGWATVVTRGIQHAVSRRRTFPLEVLLMVVALAIGSWMLVPGWDSLQGLGLYRAVGLLPETFWGAYFLLAGTYYMVGLLHAIRRDPLGARMCLHAATALAFGWATWALDFAIYNVELLGVPVWGSLAGAAGWVCWRLSIVVRRPKYRSESAEWS